MTLTGKCALVTGSTSGIGLGIARALAQQGVHVMLNGFGDKGEIDDLKGELARYGDVSVGYSDADLSAQKGADALIDATLDQLGGLDILVNNAGIQHTDRVEDFPPEKWDAIIAIMLSAPFRLAQKALPHMRDKGWGRIINIASAHGRVASPDKCAYVSAKHGLVGLNKVIALENPDTGITSNAICPGWVWTPLVEKQVETIAERDQLDIEKAKEKLLAEKQPQLEFTTPEQIGELACFLASDAARNITGTEISVDGGWTAR